MTTRTMTRVRLAALAAVALALTGLVGTPVHANDTRPVTALNGWSGKMGPGIGSSRSPFGIVEVGTPLSGNSDDTLLFHSSTGQAVQQVPVTQMGPGLGSVRSPGVTDNSR